MINISPGYDFNQVVLVVQKITLLIAQLKTKAFAKNNNRWAGPYQ